MKLRRRPARQARNHADTDPVDGTDLSGARSPSEAAPGWRTKVRQWFRRARVAGTVLVLAGVALTSYSAGREAGQRSSTRVDVTAGTVPARTAAELAPTGSASQPAAGLMPDVVGLDRAEALAVLAAAGVATDNVELTEEQHAGPGSFVVRQNPGPGAAITTDTQLVVSAEAPTPTVVGMTEDTARQALSALGATVAVDRKFVPGAAVGTVVASDPAAGRPLPAKITLTVASAGSALALGELDAIDNDCSTSSDVAINGQSYTPGWRCSTSTSSSGPTRFEYDLSRDFTQFHATFGLADETSETKIPVHFTVLVDGRRVFDKQIPFGQAIPVTLDVTGALRLVVEMNAVGPSDSYTTVYAAVGTPQLLGSPDAVRSHRTPKN